MESSVRSPDLALPQKHECCFLWFLGVILNSNGLFRKEALECGVFLLFFEFLRNTVFFLQAHSHLKELLSNAPVESVVRVTGVVSPRPPGQENPVRMFYSSWKRALGSRIVLGSMSCLSHGVWMCGSLSSDNVR